MVLAAVNEALRDAVMQCIREPIFNASGALLPRCGVIDPITAMGDICPGPDVRDPRHQRIDVAVDAVEICHLSRDPTRREPFLEACQMAKTVTQ